MKPFPILQIINLVFGVVLFAMEWPLPLLAGSSVHRSLEFRLAFLPLTTLAAALIYQGTNAAIYYFIGLLVYFWAYSEGEVRFLTLTHLGPRLGLASAPTILSAANIEALDHLRETLDFAQPWWSWAGVSFLLANMDSIFRAWQLRGSAADDSSPPMDLCTYPAADKQKKDLSLLFDFNI